MSAGPDGLWVTADDYGLCPEIDAGVLALHDLGVVNRVSFVANSARFAEAAAGLLGRPRLAVGVHLNLTDGRPVGPALQTLSLTDAHGVFPGGRHAAALLRVLSRRAKLEEVRAEWAAQIEKVRAAGIEVRHLNGHGHLHLLPPLHAMTADLAREYRIPAVRLVFSRATAKAAVLTALSRALAATLRRRAPGVVWPEATLGMSGQGSLTRERVLSEIDRYRGGRAELIVHPAAAPNAYHRVWGYRTGSEFAALSDPAVRERLALGVS